MTAATERLARFAADTPADAIPAAVAERAKLLVFDLFGNMIRAAHDAESTPSLMRSAERLGLTGGGATGIGLTTPLTPLGAALVNGTLAHSLDFDDTHAAGSIHPSAPIVPAAIVAAEMTGAGGAAALAAIIAGYEVQIRLSLALGPEDHYARGFHPTATCGVFAAAVAAGRLFGLDRLAMGHAFGIALSQAAGSLQFLEDGAWTKRFQVGYAAMGGLMAACLARDGFVGPAQAIEGRHGFLGAYAPSPDPEKAVAGLGENWETMSVAVKPYPSCRYSHAPLDALLRIRADNAIRADEVTAAEVGTSRTGLRLIGEPEAAKQNPNSVVDGQFSMPFLGAVALRTGGMGWDDYATHLKDPATLELCRRIRTTADARPEAEFPRNMSGIARVTTNRGTFEAFVVVPKGEPENFVTADELRRKFDGLVAPCLEPSRRGRLAEMLLSLESVDGIADLLALTRPAGQSGLQVAAGD